MIVKAGDPIIVIPIGRYWQHEVGVPYLKTAGNRYPVDTSEPGATVIDTENRWWFADCEVFIPVKQRILE